MAGMVDGRTHLLALLVDDDIAYLEVLKFFLERDGAIECEIATSAKQALEIMAQKEFDAVVSDYLMPEIDGLELLKIIRLQGKEVPFVMLTGRGREDVAIDALNNGADYYAQKGGDPKTQYTDLSNMIKRSAKQRRAEKRIQEDERFMKKLFESVQDGIVILDKDMTIERVNPTVDRWFADSMPLVGKRCYEAFHGRHEQCERCPSRDALMTATIKTERVARHDRAGNTVGWFEVFSFPVLEQSTGEPVRVIEYMRDVTEEESARLALQSSERRYRAVTDLTSEGVIAIESGGKIAFVNPSLARMLGYDADELVGMQIWALVDRETPWPTGTGQLHKVLEEGARVEMVFRRKDGSKVQVLVALSPVSSERGMFDGAVAVVTDISELKRAIESMVSSEDKFAKVFRTSPQMAMIARASDSVILEANDSFLAATGYTAEGLVGRSYIDLGIISKELASKIEHELSERGTLLNLETTMGTASGHDCIVRLSSYKLDLQGQECAIFLSCDLTSEGVGVKDLRNERDVLKAVLESTPNGIVISDLHGRLVECNAAFRSMMGGISREDLVGADVFTLLGGEEREKARRAAAKLVKEGVINEIQFELVRRDGIIIQTEVSVSIVNDSLGKPLYFVAVVRDVTDQARYQNDLEKALEDRRHMEAIIDDSPAVAFRWREEPGWPVDYVSGNVRSFGYDAADLMSGTVTFLSIVHPDDRDRIIQEAERELNSGSSEFEQEYRIMSPEGQVFWVYDTTKALRRQDGSLLACQGVVVDITDLKDALDRLSRTEKQLKLFMDMSPMIKFIKDRDGRFVYVNRRFEEAFGIPACDWLGKTDADMFPSEVARQFRESDRALLEAGRTITAHEFIPQPDGPHEYLTHKFLVPGAAMEGDMIAGIAVDLTDERRNELALKAANDKLSLLSSITRHDITNQLAVLMGWLDVVRDEETDPLKSKRLDGMHRAADAIQDMLLFTSEYQEVGANQPIWVSVEQAVADGASGLPMEGVRVEAEVAGMEVYADPMLERVFRNLVDNSLRHGGKVTWVRFSSREQDGRLTLVYEDDGVGVPDDSKELIFERGFGSHTGLGLFLTRQVLNLTGLTIKETGQAGKGARFEIHVPEGSHRRTLDKD